jgi:hypothetical protein
MTIRQRQTLIRKVEAWLKTSDFTPTVSAEDIVNFMEEAEKKTSKA